MGDGGRSSHVIESFLIPSPPLSDCSLGSQLLNNKRNETHTSKFHSNTPSDEAFCKAVDDPSGDSFSKVIQEAPAQRVAAISDLEFLSTCRLRRTESSSVFNFSASELARVKDSKSSFHLGTENQQNIEEEASDDACPVARNGYEDLDVQIVTSSKPSKPRKENEANKFQHTSFDSPKTKRECALKPCPSLDSSLSPLRSLTEIQLSNLDHHPSSSPYLEPGSCFHPSPRTPSTPASVVASQASLDSGVLSAHSFDLSQNVGLEVSSRRRRTGSSISSGISEVWQTSFDGEMPVTMEAVSEASNAAKPLLHAQPGLSSTNTTPATKPGSEQNDCSSSFVSSIHSFKAGSPNVEDSVTDFSRNEKSVGAPPSAHIPVDHSYVLPETRLKIHDVPLSVIFPIASEDDSVDSSVTSIDKNETSETSLLEATPRSHKMSVEGVQVCHAHPTTKVSMTESIYSSEMRHKIEKFALNLVMMALNEAFQQSVSLGWSIKCSGQCNQELCREDYKKRSVSKEGREKEPEKSLFSTIALSSCSSSLCWTPELPFSPSHRSFSRASKRSSLSFSHDSLVGGVACQDDSHLIKGAVSHEILAFPGEKEPKKVEGHCAICLESDIYSLPVDMVKPYQGPILQPKVIVQQPKKRYLNRSMRLTREKETGMVPSSKRAFHTNKRKGTKHGGHRSKDSPAASGELSAAKATTTTAQSTLSGNPGPLLCEDANENGTINEDGSSRESDRTLDAYKTRQRKEVKCSDQGKLCRIIPFTSSKPHKRKEITDAKGDRKKGRSLSSNIRNTLVTFFSFKRTHKEHGSCVNAKNEFIDASSQGFIESSDGLKWGKICPLPSAPPLRSSMKYSAFTDHVGSGAVSSAPKQSSHHKREPLGTETKTNQSNTNGNHNHQRQSNSISPASLLSCLGHPRTNSIDEQERRPRLASETPKQSAPPTSTKASTVVTKRALPPLPPSLRTGEASEGDTRSRWKPHTHDKLDEGCDFASIIEKVKNYGWYWGPISGEAAERVLCNEPDGSFIVRDSSDYHYIFSLTFRLNGVTRHVRIEHDQGNFSFGGFTRFKSQTIVDFIEKAVEHSRSGRYLFFLHRRPVLGPMRVQLLHPVSRFKHVQSLQHLCRFVIVKQVRKDLIHDLPLPQRLKDYLSSPHYYSEQVEQCMTPSSALSLDGATASPESRRLRSPCLRHTESRRQARLNSDSSKALDADPGPSVGVCSGSSSVPESSGNALSTRRRYNFSEPGTSVTGSRRNRSRDLRLSSSHSSLENCLLQTYPVSPSTLSSESNSGHPNNTKLFRKKSTPFFSGSSHSSPSSPVPFDYSPPDWLSSSEDLFQFQSAKVPIAFTRPLCNNALKPDFQTDDNFYRLTFDKGRLKTNPRPRRNGGSASPTLQSVTDAFVIDRSRNASDAHKESLHSADGTTVGKCPFRLNSENNDQTSFTPDPKGK